MDGKTIEVDNLCVGQPVRFEVCGLATSNVQLEVLQGTVTTFPLCNGSQPGTFVYTPTVAGPITIYANGNSGIPGTPALFFFRNLQVFDSPAPDFDVAGCLNNNALITLKPGSSYDRYIANFDGGPQRVPLTPGTANVVPSGGVTGVTVVGFYNDNTLCRDSLRKSFVLPPTPTPLSFTRLTQAPRAGAAATVMVAGLQAGYQYSIIREDASAPGGFSTVLDLPATTTTATLPGAAQGCYRLRRVDACQLQPATSDPICALDLSVTAAPGQNVLSFGYSGAGATSFRIERNGTLLTTLPTSGPYTDAAVLCGSSYTYRVTAVLPNGAESISNESTVTALSNNIPPPVPPLVASFTLKNTVKLTPALASPRVPRGSVLRYRKTAGSRPASDFASDTTGRAIADPALFDSLRVARPCYTVRFVDVCGNSSAESAPTCPAFLTATPADPEGNTVNLSWSNFTGPAPTAPTIYELLRLAPDGSILGPALPVSGNTATDFTPPTDRQVLRYRLRISGGGIPVDSFSYSNVASVARRVRLQLPTAFTPNGDGLNDVLEVKGRFLENYSFVVVDRNGMEVFRSTQRAETWDGRIKSHAPVNGAYVWRFQQLDETGKTVQETGTITILQ